MSFGLFRVLWNQLFKFALGGLVFIHRMSHSATVDTGPTDDTARPDRVIVRLSGPYFFGAAAQVGAALDQIADRPRHFVLDLSDLTYLDSSGVRALNLLAYFDSIHLSTAAGAAKPDPAIFLTALQANDLQPAQGLHIGDQWEADVMGARAAGLSALWLTRNLTLKSEPTLSQITSLHPNVILL